MGHGLVRVDLGGILLAPLLVPLGPILARQQVLLDPPLSFTWCTPLLANGQIQISLATHIVCRFGLSILSRHLQALPLLHGLFGLRGWNVRLHYVRRDTLRLASHQLAQILPRLEDLPLGTPLQELRNGLWCYQQILGCHLWHRNYFHVPEKIVSYNSLIMSFPNRPASAMIRTTYS